jgi:hypothetical protein
MTRPDSSANTSPSRRRRVLKIVLILLALFVGFPVGAWLYYSHRADQELKAAVAELDRREPGAWRLEDLEAKRAVVPEEENAALVVMKIKELLPWPWPTPTPPGATPEPLDLGGKRIVLVARDTRTVDEWLNELPPEVRLYEPLPTEIRTELEKAKLALAEARKLSTLSRGRFPLTFSSDYLSTRLEEQQEVRKAVTLLWLDVAIQAEDADIDGALKSCQAILVAAQTLGDEPILISMLIRLACQGQAVSAIERTLAQGEPAADGLKALQQLAEDEAAQPLLEIVLRGERAGQFRALQALIAGELTWDQLVDGQRGPAKLEDKLLGPLLAKKTLPVLLRTLTEWIEIAKLPVEQQRPRFVVAAQKLEGLRTSDKFAERTAGVLLTAIGRVSDSFFRNQVQLRCAAAALAAERYRRQHGRWPESLDALTAAGFLDKVPADPFDGKPLRLRRLDDGLVIYSVGPDLTDDGGRTDWKQPLKPGTDLAFRLWDVAQRRQPAAQPIDPPRNEAEAIGPER